MIYSKDIAVDFVSFYKCFSRAFTFKSGLFFRFFIILFSIAGFGQESIAQLGSKSQEVWPSIDIYYRVNPKFRFYGTAGGTRLENSSYTDGAIGFFGDFFVYPLTKILRSNHADSLPGKYLWFRAGYQYSATPPSAEDPFKESMIVTEGNLRFYLPFEILMTSRNRLDWRVKNGEFNTRYRPKLTIDKDLHTDYLTFTANASAEYFFNFGNSSVNRFRMQFGIEIKVMKRFNYEVFWNRQFENLPEIQQVDAFGMTLKFYLSRDQKIIELHKRHPKPKKSK